MSRPPKFRRVCFQPGVTYFKPAGIPVKILAENCLSLEEMEAVRLRDLEHLEQTECAVKMNISRSTFQRVLAAARKKIADSLLCGKALRIEGGNYSLVKPRFRCGAGHEWENEVVTSGAVRSCPVCHSPDVRQVPVEEADFSGQGKGAINGDGTLKIAVVTDDEKTISQHFGRAAKYLVITTEGGKIKKRETRPKAGHADFTRGMKESGESGGSEIRGHRQGGYGRHHALSGSIRDCQVVLAGGMGYGAYEGLKSNGVDAVVTGIVDIDDAVNLYLKGKLPNLIECLH